MTGYRELLEKEVIEAWRTHRIVLVGALYIVLGIASPVVIRYLPELQGLFGPVNEELGFGELGLPDAIDLLVRNVVQFGSIAAVLLAVLVPAAITFLGSVIAGSSLGAATFGIGGLVVLSLGSTLPTANPFFSTGLAELARAMPIEGIGPDLDPARTVVVSIGIVAASLGVAWWRFRRMDV